MQELHARRELHAGQMLMTIDDDRDRAKETVEQNGGGPPPIVHPARAHEYDKIAKVALGSASLTSTDDVTGRLSES